jgi:hypothetical protein
MSSFFTIASVAWRRPVEEPRFRSRVKRGKKKPGFGPPWRSIIIAVF